MTCWLWFLLWIGAVKQQCIHDLTREQAHLVVGGAINRGYKATTTAQLFGSGLDSYRVCIQRTTEEQGT